MKYVVVKTIIEKKNSQLPKAEAPITHFG